MEYHGYKVFADRYEDLTVDQALFIDLGLADLYEKMYNTDEVKNANNKGWNNAKRVNRHVKQF